MKCPSCAQRLSAVVVQGGRVRACQGGCGGLWFDRFELAKLRGHFHGAGEKLLDIDRAEGVRFYRDVEPICPKCQTTLLFRHFFSKRQDVEVDPCSKCGGLWVDPGELANFMRRPLSEAARKKAFADYFQTIFGERIAAMDLFKQDVHAAAQSVVNIFLFICPRQYLPQASPF